MERLKTLACQQLKTLVIGAVLAFGGFFASGLLVWAIGIDAHSLPGASMLVFIACMTPTMIYADYLRSVPGMYVTLFCWLWACIWCSIWTVSAWLNLTPQNRSWDRGAGMAAFAIAFFATHAIHRRMARGAQRG